MLEIITMNIFQKLQESRQYCLEVSKHSSKVMEWLDKNKVKNRTFFRQYNIFVGKGGHNVHALTQTLFLSNFDFYFNLGCIIKYPNSWVQKKLPSKNICVPIKLSSQKF
jgi:hypothetical protein